MGSRKRQHALLVTLLPNHPKSALAQPHCAMIHESMLICTRERRGPKQLKVCQNCFTLNPKQSRVTSCLPSHVRDAGCGARPSALEEMGSVGLGTKQLLRVARGAYLVWHATHTTSLCQSLCSHALDGCDMALNSD